MIITSGSALVYLRHKVGDLEERADTLSRLGDENLQARAKAYRKIAKELQRAYEELVDWKGAQMSDLD